MQLTSEENPTGALVLEAGAIRAYVNASANQALVSGLIADEFGDRGGGYQAEDSRQPLLISQYPYDLLSHARSASLEAISVLEKYNRNPTSRIAELFAYAGLVETYIAENMCSGVPIALVGPTGATAGPQLTGDSILGLALTHFDSAVKYAAGFDSVSGLARVGKARALLDRGQYSGAANSAASVAPSLSYQPPYDGVVQYNSIYQAIAVAQGVTVSNVEGTNGLPYVSAGDPRVPTAFVTIAANGDTIYTFASYNSLATPITAASGVEARLIAAESLLPVHGGSGHAWLDTLNALRTNGTYTISGSGDTTYQAGEGNIGGLPPLTDPQSDSARLTLVVHERAFWLFGTGHRQGDLRRLINQYGLPRERVFPTGLYDRGPTTYGPDVNFEPFGENGNPNYRRCTSRES